ncbi:family 65 glycosyl hydrolase domain-containing protein [Candidatus Darwinibacter acetoxidans]
MIVLRPLLGIDEWSVSEEGFHPESNRFMESIMSLGNGYMGLRGNFEESYSGDHLQGTYIAGVYYPDRTVVGWWKVGYPEYFAKVLNAVNFIGIDVQLDGRVLDLHTWRPSKFRRTLDMYRGELVRSFQVEDGEGRVYSVEARRFVSKDRRELACIRYSLTLLVDPPGRGAQVKFTPYLEGNVVNEDANYGEDFWQRVEEFSGEDYQLVTMEVKKSGFVVAAASTFRLYRGQEEAAVEVRPTARPRYAGAEAELTVHSGETVSLEKLVAVTTSRDHPRELVSQRALELVRRYCSHNCRELFARHAQAWAKTWGESDIVIEGDPAAQQGIRFNIFHLHQTYTGEDPRLNIGPKGFTGEKYGGGTYWDTEAYCLPFYLGTREPEIARNLLLYRYNHLEKAKENARKLGLKGALYPMVTMNGEECHNEWEITFEEIHRNGAIAYAIFNYVRYTGDGQYLEDYGLEVLVEICRFWASRVTFQPRKGVYMILGVTGPNEYENNVNNNWYTNRIAVWCLEYTMEVLAELRRAKPDSYRKLVDKLQLQQSELEHWSDIAARMYYPYVEELGVFEQQDGFMDKELLTVADLSPEDLPLNQNWSWDRILRSCFIKQADVLQGLFFLGHLYDLETKKRNFDFYEPMTVHESSLSPCVHAIIAAEIGYHDKAYELYLRTARLDLDNYNKDTDDGLHITSMAGTWMAIVYGFAGLRIENDRLTLRPFLPGRWKSYSFGLLFRGHRLKVQVTPSEVVISQEGGARCDLVVHGQPYGVEADGQISIPH